MTTPTTDRELLELAAKAAGYKIYAWEGENAVAQIPNQLGGGVAGWVWNPLTDDGDALRLAVHIGLIVNAPSPISTHATVKFYDIEISEPVKGCRFAATRRAIVRAAAEIGKAMP